MSDAYETVLGQVTGKRQDAPHHGGGRPHAGSNRHGQWHQRQHHEWQHTKARGRQQQGAQQSESERRREDEHIRAMIRGVQTAVLVSAVLLCTLFGGQRGRDDILTPLRNALGIGERGRLDGVLELEAGGGSADFERAGRYPAAWMARTAAEEGNRNPHQHAVGAASLAQAKREWLASLQGPAEGSDEPQRDG